MFKAGYEIQVFGGTEVKVSTDEGVYRGTADPDLHRIGDRLFLALRREGNKAVALVRFEAIVAIEFVLE